MSKIRGSVTFKFVKKLTIVKPAFKSSVVVIKEIISARTLFCYILQVNKSN